MEKQLEEQMINSTLVVQRRIDSQDGWVWLREEEQQYTVKSGYIILNRKSIVERSEVFQELWTLKVAPSALICVWKAMLDKLSYVSQLCKRVDETVQHLFINCVVMQEVWDACDR